MAHKGVQVLMPGTCVLGYMAKEIKTEGGGKVADYLTLRSGEYTDLFRWSQYKQESPLKWEKEKEGRTREKNVRRRGPHVIGFEDEEMGP